MLSFLLAATVAHLIAVAAWPLVRRGGGLSVTAAALTVGLLAISPALVPPEHSIWRGLAAFVATDHLFKVVDYLRCIRQGEVKRPVFGHYWKFLIPFPVMLVVWEQRRARLAERPRLLPETGYAALTAAAFLGGTGVFYLANTQRLVQAYFVVDHVVKLALVVVLIESASQFVYRLERCFGYDTTPPMQNFVLSRTVAEFWCRWNTRVQSWLQYNVFWPTGGRRAPVRGVVHSFFWSAVVHEVMLGVATARFDGYQFTFFMLQILPVLGTRYLERFAHRAGRLGIALAHVVTISWIAVTSVLFFPAIDRVLPFFYVSEPVLP